jgi:hypothetical protein
MLSTWGISAKFTSQFDKKGRRHLLLYMREDADIRFGMSTTQGGDAYGWIAVEDT